MFAELTEAWGVAYFQILITLVVFALGIPAFIYHMEPENIRHIIKKHVKIILLGSYIFVSIITLMALCFVWYLHPVNQATESIDPFKQVLGSIIISLSLCVTIIIWWHVWVKLLKETVVKHLEKKLFKRYKKDGSIIDEWIKDLLALGERSDAGYEKEIVLKRLESLIKRIQDSERYSGNDLDPILRISEKIVISKDKPGNETDFQMFTDIMAGIFDRLSSKMLQKDGDRMLAYNVLTEIGKKAAELEFSKQVSQIVMIASSNSEALFEIGMSAFKSGNYLSAISALNATETLALKAIEVSQFDSSSINELFGLLAHFWTENRGSRKRAESFLYSNRDEFPYLETFLDRAIDYHYFNARYDTTDKLITMQEEIIMIRQQQREIDLQVN